MRVALAHRHHNFLRIVLRRQLRPPPLLSHAGTEAGQAGRQGWGREGGREGWGRQAGRDGAGREGRGKLVGRGREGESGGGCGGGRKTASVQLAGKICSSPKSSSIITLGSVAPRNLVKFLRATDNSRRLKPLRRKVEPLNR